MRRRRRNPRRGAGGSRFLWPLRWLPAPRAGVWNDRWSLDTVGWSSLRGRTGGKIWWEMKIHPETEPEEKQKRQRIEGSGKVRWGTQ